jgi:DNA replication and repair protein RecF
MSLDNLNLVNFRSYGKTKFEFGLRTVVVGDNGSGKSNLIEAICLIATGRSFRADKDEEMIKYGSNFAFVSGQLSLGDEIKVVFGERKMFEVNGVARRMADATGRLKVVMFGPGDMEIVTGSPGVRRRYLDMVISQKDREYHRSLIAYEKGLRQRNKLLDLIRDGQAGRGELIFWDKLVIANGQYLTEKREEYLDSVGFGYDKSIISEERLAQYAVAEVAAGNTLVGPHRDDFVVTREGRDVSKFGSRGEQRMAIWWLKQCEIMYLGDSPVLLLDDIYSELDHKHREEVKELVERYPGQVIMTTADKHLLPDNKDWNIIRL